jgi:uncharacterized membrane protein
LPTDHRGGAIGGVTPPATVRSDDGGQAHRAESAPVYGAAMSPGLKNPDEHPKERHDRELIELLNELRVALPGVQVLFAFMLTVPFAQGWKGITTFQKDVFFIGFIATAVSSALLIAPSSYHRLRWRVEDKGRIVRISNRLTIAGLFVLAIAIGSVVLLVTDYIFDKTTAVATTAALMSVYVGLWYGLPLYGWYTRRS